MTILVRTSGLDTPKEFHNCIIRNHQKIRFIEFAGVNSFNNHDALDEELIEAKITGLLTSNNEANDHFSLIDFFDISVGYKGVAVLSAFGNTLAEQFTGLQELAHVVSRLS